jgi:predicted O-linked N-acetylglucosamine transferase (SPINDLY family)
VSANTLNADTSSVAQNLWRDTQPFQQQACSSPRVLYVLYEKSDKINESLVALFKQLNALAEQAKDDWQAVGRTNEHLVLMQNIALMGDSVANNAVLQLSRVSAINISKLSSSLLEMHDGNGLFFVRICQSLQQIVAELSACLPEKLQTIAINGVEQSRVEKKVTQLLPQAQFRVQALGQALDFDFKWDGYDLLSSLCQALDLPQA